MLCLSRRAWCLLPALEGKDKNAPLLCSSDKPKHRRSSNGSNNATNLSEPSWSLPPAWGLILLSTKAQGFLSRLHTLQPLCISPAGIIVVGIQINSSIMQPVSSAWSRHLSFFFSPLSTSAVMDFYLDWNESPVVSAAISWKMMRQTEGWDPVDTAI